MGEISFNYTKKDTPIYEIPFKYWFENSKEYSFAYQRYIALSDTSIFNDPVAISKVASGFYYLHDLFVDKETYSIIFYKNNINIQKDSKSIVLFNNNLDVEETNRMSILPILFNPERINRMSILHTLINAEKINKFKIYSNLFIEKNNDYNVFHQMYQTHKDNTTNILQNNLCIKTMSYANIYENINTLTYKTIVNLLPTFSMYKDCIMYTNIFPDFLMNIDIKTGNIIQTIFGKKDIIITNIIQQIYTQKEKFYHGNIIEQINVSSYMKYGNINEILSSPYGNKISSLNPILPIKIKYERQLNYLDFFSIAKQHNYDSDIANTIFTYKNNLYNFNETSCYGCIKNEKYACKLDIDTFAITEEKYTFTSMNKIIDIKNIKDVMITFGIWNNIQYKNILTDDKNEFVIHNYKKSNISNNIIFFKKSHKESLLSNHIVFYSKFRNNTFITNNTVFFKKSYKDSLLVNKLSFLDKIKKPARYDYYNIYLFRKNKNLGILDVGINLYKATKNVYINKDNVFIHKIPKDMTINKDNVFIHKISKDMNIYNKVIDVFKVLYKISVSKEDIWVLKDSVKMIIDEQTMVYRNKYFSQIYNQGHFLLKNLISVDSGTLEDVIKNQLPLDTLNSITNNFSGMIIPMSKVKRPVFIDSINEMVHKLNKNIYISYGTFSSVLPKNIYTMHYDDFQLFCDKKQHQVFIDYKNEMIIKTKIYATMHDDVFIKKEPKESYIGNIWFTQKERKDIWIQDITTGIKSYHEVTIHDDEIAEEEINEVSMLQTLFVDKDSQMCYYTYDTTAKKEIYDLLMHQEISAIQDNKQIQLADLIPEAIKTKTSIFYDYVVFSNRIIKESKLYQQIDEALKISKELMIHPDDFGNWAWVYETPDPMDPTYGIDELLLPENDTRYEDFEDIIFNKKTLRPRQPVKIINETTFIAKYPHKHPIPEYKDVAIDYDKSAIKLEQYYGIKTEIMRTVFLKYYRIWQSKIFEFGSMNMLQAVKKMLDYLYSWIMIYFNTEDLEQALRVFRLIRWYGESAVIQNSQYIVSYEYDTLESKLTTGTCNIPNNLDVNDSMIIDAALGVIKCNPIYIGPSSTAYVEFNIDNRKNTSITFSLSNTIGSVNIYINNVLIDTLSNSALNITYPIPYTGDVNVVRIEKPIGHNLNQYFYIGNIKVPDLSFKDLSIEFDATLKMGNKPLDEIAKKMIQYANMYDDMQDTYYRLKRSNLGIQETYKKMLEYWELHHQHKTKGKRLTIKEI